MHRKQHANKVKRENNIIIITFQTKENENIT